MTLEELDKRDRKLKIEIDAGKMNCDKWRYIKELRIKKESVCFVFKQPTFMN